jgi:hypothetical protein
MSHGCFISSTRLQSFFARIDAKNVIRAKHPGNPQVYSIHSPEFAQRLAAAQRQ